MVDLFLHFLLELVGFNFVNRWGWLHNFDGLGLWWSLLRGIGRIAGVALLLITLSPSASLVVLWFGLGLLLLFGVFASVLRLIFLSGLFLGFFLVLFLVLFLVFFLGLFLDLFLGLLLSSLLLEVILSLLASLDALLEALSTALPNGLSSLTHFL